jgi:P2-related tail formation protein
MPIILPPDPPAPITIPPPGDAEAATTAGERLYDRLAPVATYDEENGGVVAALADMLALPQAVVDDIARDDLSRPAGTQLAWQPLLDPDTTPWIDWLAQFPGVKLLPSDLTDEAKRARVKQAAGFYRGTTRAIVEAVQPTLTGNQTVIVQNQVGGDVWAQTVITRTSETPDAATTTRAALTQKAAGVIQTMVISDVPIIDEGTRTIDAATVTIDAPPTPADVT